MTDLREIQKKLLEPFPEEVIRQRDGLDYVEPYYYFMRWQECFPYGFRFECTVSDWNGCDGKAMVGHAEFDVYVSESAANRDYNPTRYTIKVPVVEPYQIGRSSGDIQKADQSANKFTSAGCKNVSRVIGLGLHLYKKDDSHGQGADSPSKSPSLGGAYAKAKAAAVGPGKPALSPTGGGSAAQPPEYISVYQGSEKIHSVKVEPEENPVEKGKAYAFLADLRRSTGTSDTLYTELLKELFPGKSSPKTGIVSEGDLTIAELRQAAKELKRRTKGG